MLLTLLIASSNTLRAAAAAEHWRHRGVVCDVAIDASIQLIVIDFVGCRR